MLYHFHLSVEAIKVPELHPQAPCWWLAQRSVTLQAGLGQWAFHSTPRAAISVYVRWRAMDRQTAMAKGNTVNLDLGVTGTSQDCYRHSRPVVIFPTGSQTCLEPNYLLTFQYTSFLIFKLIPSLVCMYVYVLLGWE